MPELPLEGRRVLVTRAVHQASKLSDGLRRLGAEAVEVPVLEIRPPADCAPLDHALRVLNSYDWLILTSSNTVRVLSERAEMLGLRLGAADRLRVAAVGDATATAAKKVGFPVAVVPESYVAECLVERLASETGGKKVLLARAEIARDVIPEALRVAGARVDVVDAYKNVIPETAPERLREALDKGIDAATFTSSSSVTHLADAARAAGLDFPFAGVAAISIGPVTSQTLREFGWKPAAEASVSDITGLVEATRRVLAG